jgi:predicted TIM-barrel fold metal-dependent hydrolase
MITEVPIVDADSHLSEVPDLWTARMSSARWGDQIPRVVHDERLGMDRWLIAGKKLTTVANWATAGWTEYPPSHPPTLEQADPAAFYAKDRLIRMDEYGIYAQVLYPNLLTFSNHAFRALEPALALECVRVYNDYLLEFATDSGQRERFVLLATVPFWDLDATLQELERCAGLGFQGLLFIAKPYKIGLPPLSDEHWAPLFARVQELGWSVNFHTGFAEFSEDDFRAMLSRKADRRDYARLSATSYLNNAEALAEVVMSGLCHRYPSVSFVSVESAFGWVPSFVESMDWQWLNSGAAKAFPEMEMPSFYFRRQVYGMFWFEQESVRRQLDLYPDNVLFETDFPHPTSLSPGPASAAKDPRQVVVDFFDGLPEDLARKVLYENAARLYQLDVPASIAAGR